jgi:hypothetical protein
LVVWLYHVTTAVKVAAANQYRTILKLPVDKYPNAAATSIIINTVGSIFSLCIFLVAPDAQRALNGQKIIKLLYVWKHFLQRSANVRS